MRKVTISVCMGVGFAGCGREDTLEFEVDDDATGDQIEKEAEEICNEWAHNFLDIGFSIDKIENNE